MNAKDPPAAPGDAVSDAFALPNQQVAVSKLPADLRFSRTAGIDFNHKA
jgi:hypothetical protein